MAASMRWCRVRLFARRTACLYGRFYCQTAANETKCVRVRFAPSPTGRLHLGGLRTALYNFLFARSHGGAFVLRIEDTDQTRFQEGAAESLEAVLQWAGIVPDESPLRGGSYGPYTQSQRLQLYQSHIEKLLENGSAYRCFCTPKRLELLRKEAARRGETPKYDNRCRSLSKAAIEEYLAKDAPHTVRLKLEEDTEGWEDLVKGRIIHNVAHIEGDPILMKSDKFPTYHFANVVDDHRMEITHVLRGEEWQLSTPKHLLLYRAFGWNPPRFAHLPLILNKDGTKLSKRQGDVHVESFKERGFLPEAVTGYLTKVGGGFHYDDLDEPLGLTVEEMVHKFLLELVRRQSGRLDPEWLKKANRLHLKRKLGSPGRSEVIQQSRALLSQHFAHREGVEQEWSDAYVGQILDWTLTDDRVTCLGDLLGAEWHFLWVCPSPQQTLTLGASHGNLPQILATSLRALETLAAFSTEDIGAVLKSGSRSLGVKYGLYMKILRQALSGLKEGPPVAEMMIILGKETTLARLRMALEVLERSQSQSPPAEQAG